jgi:hypothetical protein
MFLQNLDTYQALTFAIFLSNSDTNLLNDLENSVVI